MVLGKFRIILQLKFIKTNKKEKTPTKEEFDKYMKGKYYDMPRYKKYLESLYFYDIYGKIPEKIKYLGDGKIQYELTEIKPSTYKDKKGKIIKLDGDFRNIGEIMEYLIMQESGLVDGIWEGEPGSEGVYPTKSEYPEELGLIGINLKKTKIEKIN